MPTKFKTFQKPVSAKQKTSVICIRITVNELRTPGEIHGLHITGKETKSEQEGWTQP